jgi:hypothetical protein
MDPALALCLFIRLVAMREGERRGREREVRLDLAKRHSLSAAVIT